MRNKLTHGDRLHYQNIWLACGCLLLFVIIYSSLTSAPIPLPNINMADKYAHITAYCALMGWFGQLYKTKYQLTLFVIGFILMGVSLEYLQGMTGYRTFDYADMAANTVGVLLGLLLTRTLFAGFLAGIEHKLGVVHH